MINQQIKLLESELSCADGYDRALDVLDKIEALVDENRKRLKVAHDSYRSCSVEAQNLAEDRTIETKPFSNFFKYGKEDELWYACEYWESLAIMAEHLDASTAIDPEYLQKLDGFTTTIDDSPEAL